MKKNETFFLKKPKKNKKKTESKLIIFGLNTVKSALNSKYLEIEKLIIKEENKNNKEIINIAKNKKIETVFLDKEKFLKFGFDKKNQGVVAIIKKYKYLTFNELINEKKEEKKLIVLLDSIEDPHNFGAILRNAAAFDISGIIIKEKNQVPINSTVIKVSVGGASYIPITKVENLKKTIELLKEENFKIISTICEENHKCVSIEKLKLEYKLCLILGNEHDGIQKQLIEKSDYLLNIPLSKNMPSLNVSVTSGILFYKLKT